MLRYRLCEKKDCGLWIKLNREFMVVELLDDELWNAAPLSCRRIQFQSELTNPGATEFYKAIGYQPADMKLYVKYLD